MHAVVHAADIQDRDGGPLVIETLRGLFPFVTKLFADGGYQGPQFRKALAKVMPQLSVEIVKRSDTAKSFQVLPRRRVVAGSTKLPARPLSGWKGSSVFNCGLNFTPPHPS